jgi:hypothetical protein
MKVSHHMDTVLPVESENAEKPVAAAATQSDAAAMACFSEQVEDISQELIGDIADK